MASDNIILIGMPGAGKSTLGVVLAKILGKDFFDCDLAIQQQQGKKLHEIIDEYGVEEFLAVENEVLSNIDVSNSIISTGGSAIYSPRAMAHLAELGPVVYLSISYDSLKTRLEDLHERGVVMRTGVTESLRDLYDERLPLYEQFATLTVDVNDLTITGAARRVADALNTLSD